MGKIFFPFLKMDCSLALVISSTGKQRIRRKTCIPIRENAWEKYLRAFPNTPVYVENARLALRIRKRFPRREIIPLRPSFFEEVETEVGQYLPRELASLALAYTRKKEKHPFYLRPREEIEEEVQEYLPPVLSSLALGYIQEREEFVRMWGIHGTGEGEFRYPAGVAALPSGEIVVADTSNHRIQVFTLGGEFLYRWGKVGNKAGEFENPYNVAASPSGEIIVADTDNNRIQVFSSEGEFIRMWGKRGNREGEFYAPQGVATLPSGEIVVADTWNNRMQVFTSEGKFLRMWGAEQGRNGNKAGEFYYPRGIAVLPSDEIVIADSLNNRIQVFTPEGKFLRMWGAEQGGAGTKEGEFNRPNGVTALPSGDIVVADTSNHRMQVFTSEGKFLRMWGVKGTGAGGTFNNPNGVTALPSGEIVVADSWNNRIQVFRTVLD